MRTKTLLAAAFAATLAVSLAYAGGDKKASSSSPSAAAPSADGGAETMFKALDKNSDGFITQEEAKGTPHEKDFTALDRNSDGKLSREEHAAAPEHAGKAAAADSHSATGSETTAAAPGSSKKY
jgi:EF hand domain-containing protein